MALVIGSGCYDLRRIKDRGTKANAFKGHRLTPLSNRLNLWSKSFKVIAQVYPEISSKPGLMLWKGRRDINNAITRPLKFSGTAD